MPSPRQRGRTQPMAWAGLWLSPTPAPSPTAKSRSIALPMDLDAHVSSLLNSSSTSTVQRNTSSYKTATRTFPRVSTTPNQWDYKNIIEKLQVRGQQVVVGGAASPLRGSEKTWALQACPVFVFVSPWYVLS